MKKLILIITLVLSFSAEANYIKTESFLITQTFVTSATNMHFRVYGMANVAECASGQNWAYINESDSGATTKISSLLAAYAAGQKVVLTLQPIDFYGNGKLYCQIVAVGTSKQ